MPNNNIEIYSEEVQDIIEHRPNWLIRNSIISIFLIIVIVLAVSCIIKYPETTVLQSLKIEPITPSYQFISQNQGNLKILKENHTKVQKGDWIAYIETTINISNIEELDRYIVETSPLIDSESLNSIKIKKNSQLGELEVYLNNFTKSLESLQAYVRINPEAYEVKALENDIKGQKSQIDIKQDEIKKIKENLDLKKSNLESNRQLYEKGYLSKSDYENILRDYNESEREYYSIQSSVQSYSSGITKSKDQSSQIAVGRQLNLVELKRNVINNFMILKEEFGRWKEKNMFIAPYDGEIDFLKVWNSNHYVAAGEHLITLKPMSEGIMARGYISGKNLGKVEIGQKATIKLEGYLNTEYGMLEGKVQNVSTYPDVEGLYAVTVKLPENLKTTYDVVIPYRPELSGQGEIILKDQTLFELFIKNIKTLIDNGNSQ